MGTRILSDLDDSVREGIKDRVHASARALGGDEYDYAIWDKAKADYGLCSSCEEMRYTELEYGTKFACCTVWDKMLYETNRVVVCTAHNLKGQLSLRAMVDIATIIDPDPKDKVGFVPNQKKESPANKEEMITADGEVTHKNISSTQRDLDDLEALSPRKVVVVKS